MLPPQGDDVGKDDQHEAGVKSKFVRSTPLPRGWLRPEWVEFACRVDDALGKGKLRFVDNVVKGERLFLWIRSNCFPNLNVSQYRTAVKRMIEPPGPGYRKRSTELNPELSKLLLDSIQDLGKKPWACNLAFDRIKKKRKQSTSSSSGSSQHSSQSLHAPRQQTNEPDYHQQLMHQPILFEEGEDAMDQLLMNDNIVSTELPNRDWSPSSRTNTNSNKRTFDDLLIPTSDSSPTAAKSRRMGEHQQQLVAKQNEETLPPSSSWNPFTITKSVLGSLLPSFLVSAGISGDESHGYITSLLDTVYMNFKSKFGGGASRRGTDSEPGLLERIKLVEQEVKQQFEHPEMVAFTATRGRNEYLYCCDTFVRVFGEDRSKVTWDHVPRAELGEVLNSLVYRSLGYHSYKTWRFHGFLPDGTGMLENPCLKVRTYHGATIYVHLFFRYRPDLQCFIAFGCLAKNQNLNL